MLLRDIDTVDEVLRSHSAELGSDYAAYRNHVYRVLNLCAAQSSPDSESLEKVALAAVFHDLGIWTDGTFDYLPPSIRLATAYLLRTGRNEWTPEIAAMILEHHKISRYRGDSGALVESFPAGGLDRRLTRPAPFRASAIGRQFRLLGVAERRLSSATPSALARTRAHESTDAASDDPAVRGAGDYASRKRIRASAYISGAVVMPSCACPGSTSFCASGRTAARASVM